MVKLIKSSFIAFMIGAISLLAATIIGNIVLLLIATLELYFSESYSSITSLYISLLFRWSNWDYVLIFYIKTLGVLYVYCLINILNKSERSLYNQHKM